MNLNEINASLIKANELLTITMSIITCDNVSNDDKEISLELYSNISNLLNSDIQLDDDIQLSLKLINDWYGQKRYFQLLQRDYDIIKELTEI